MRSDSAAGLLVEMACLAYLLRWPSVGASRREELETRAAFLNDLEMLMLANDLTMIRAFFASAPSFCWAV